MIRVLLALVLLSVSFAASAASKEEAYDMCRQHIADNPGDCSDAGWSCKIEDVQDSPPAPVPGRCQVFRKHSSWSHWEFRFQWAYTTDCPSGEEWDPITQHCVAACVPGTTSSSTGRTTAKPIACNADGCSVTWTPNGPPFVVVGSDGVPVSWQHYSGVTTSSHCTLAPDTDGDGTPDTTDSEPTNPDEYQDSDGDGIGDNNDPMPDDPTNGEDDGIGDESDNASSGGGTCASPPVSSGDAIAAQIAYQTWATRCAIEKLNGATTGNGSGTTPGGGTDMTATNAKLDGIKTGTDNLAGDSDMSEGSASGTIADIWSNETETPDFDMGGLGLSRSCPSPPTITLAGMSRTIDTSALCDLSEVIAALVLVMTAAHAAYIFAGRSA